MYRSATLELVQPIEKEDSGTLTAATPANTAFGRTTRTGGDARSRRVSLKVMF